MPPLMADRVLRSARRRAPAKKSPSVRSLSRPGFWGSRRGARRGIRRAAPSILPTRRGSWRLRRLVPSERPSGDPGGSCLLVRSAELGEGDREADERLAVAGGDSGGAFDHGGGDRVVAGSVTASLDTGCGAGVAVEHGGLRPQRGVPRSVLPAAQGPEQLRVVDIDGESPHGPGRVVAMQREQAVEYRRPTQQ